MPKKKVNQKVPKASNKKAPVQKTVRPKAQRSKPAAQPVPEVREEPQAVAIPQPVADPSHFQTHLKCEYGDHVVRGVPVVIEWGKKKEGTPQHIGRPIKRAACVECDREHRGVKAPERKEKKQTSAPEAGNRKAPGQPRSRGNDAARIYRLRKDNPRKEGTHGWNSWNLVKDGMTVAEYLQAGGRRNDLAWDIDHGWVELKD